MMFFLNINAQIFNNTISSDQTACNNGVAFPLRGSIPDISGYAVNYLWQFSNDSVNWSIAPPVNDTVDYFISIPLVTFPEFYFRRIVTAGPFSDTSNTVTIHVLIGTEFISGNTIGSDQSVCIGQLPSPIGGGALTGGTGTYYYLWLKSYDSLFQNPLYADGVNTNFNYDFPSSLSSSEYYIRIVAIDSFITQCPTPSNIVNIEVYSITNNIISPDQTICLGDTPQTLTGPLPDLTNILSYQIEWQQSANGTTWFPANGINNMLDYNPGFITYNQYYRRKISANINLCGMTDTFSNILSVIINPPITGNNIFPSIDNNLCSGNHTLLLSDINLTGGDGIYYFRWEMSLTGVIWQSATGLNNKPFYRTNALVSNTFFRRIVESGGCSDTSNIVSINIISNPALTNNYIHFGSTIDSIYICGGHEAGIISGTIPQDGTGTYEYFWWKNSLGHLPYIIESPPLSYCDYNVGMIDTSAAFYRVVYSGLCHDHSNPVFVFINGIVNNYIESDQQICFGQQADTLKGIYHIDMPTSTIQYLWEQSTDSISWVPANGINYVDFYVPGILAGSLYFRRTVAELTGTCSSTPNKSNVVKIDVGDLIGNNFIYNATYLDNSICYNTNTQLGPNPLNPDPTGGDGTYTFLWQDSIPGSVWQDAPGINNYFGYQTPNLTQNIFYRRIVSSCSYTNSSPPILIVIDSLPVYYLSIDDSICINDGAEIYFEFYGTPPWTIELTDGANNFTLGPETYSPYFDYMNTTTNTTYTILSIMDGNNCYADITVQDFPVIVFDIPNVYAGIDTVICGLKTEKGLNAEFSLPQNTGEWSSPDNIYFEDCTNPKSNVHVDSFGSYLIEWQENNGYCFNYACITVTFIQKLLDTVNYAGINQNLDYQNFASLSAILLEGYSGEWSVFSGNGVFEDPNNPKTIVYDLNIGENYITWTQNNDFCGNKTDTITLDINNGIEIPNGFSPNGDGVNDYFEIKGLIDEFEPCLYVFNRWGVEIQHFENYKNTWDGTNDDGINLPDDTYYYMLEVHKGRQVFKGFVVIKR
ncbi:MAG: gliding motility-associated C-terminal domain-containing protein [Bacteroidota bacterium]